MKKNISLKKYNTFGIDVKADWLSIIESSEQLLTIIDDLPKMRKLILGEGSNVLFLSDFHGIVLINEIKGKNIIYEDNDTVLIEVKGGEKWHDLVMWAVENNYGGIENLALIPGKTGTAPIQNIGAYGVEIKDVIKEVHTIEMNSGKHKIFSTEDCKFGYRHSIFKLPENKNQYFIESIVIQLTKRNHKTNIKYGDIKQILEKKNISSPTIKEIAEAIINIRRSKLPDSKIIGNAGSFFKNPIVEKEIFKKIHKQYADIPFYKINDNKIKIPAGWLIEKAGFKGKRYGNIGVHSKQALVLVNFGNGTGKEIKNLADKIIYEIKQKFYIILQPEVNYI